MSETPTRVAGPGDGIAAVILGFVGLGSVFYDAYLGGDMVFAKARASTTPPGRPAARITKR